MSTTAYSGRRTRICRRGGCGAYTSDVELDKVERSVVVGALLVVDGVLDVGEVEELTPEGLTVEEAAVGGDVEVWFYP